MYMVTGKTKILIWGLLNPLACIFVAVYDKILRSYQVLDRVSVNDTTVIDILVFYGNFQIFLLMEELLHRSFMLSARGI